MRAGHTPMHRALVVMRTAHYAARMGLPKDRWQLLHGGEGDVRELAAVLGVQYRKEESGAFAHSNIIFLINPDGEVVYKQAGLGTAPEPMQEAVIKMLSGAESP